MKNISYKEVSNDDRKWVHAFIKKYWSSDKVVVHNTIYYPENLDGFFAEYKSKKIGLITYLIKDKKCEIVTINSLIENQGIGSNLVELVINDAKKKRCKNVWLITTNDNINAICFYLKLGFYLIKVYPDALTESRKIKPEIPIIGANGIPMRDELEFTYHL